MIVPSIGDPQNHHSIDPSSINGQKLQSSPHGLITLSNGKKYKVISLIIGGKKYDDKHLYFNSDQLNSIQDLVEHTFKKSQTLKTMTNLNLLTISWEKDKDTAKLTTKAGGIENPPELLKSEEFKIFFDRITNIFSKTISSQEPFLPITPPLPVPPSKGKEHVPKITRASGLPPTGPVSQVQEGDEDDEGETFVDAEEIPPTIPTIPNSYTASIIKLPVPPVAQISPTQQNSTDNEENTLRIETLIGELVQISDDDWRHGQEIRNNIKKLQEYVNSRMWISKLTKEMKENYNSLLKPEKDFFVTLEHDQQVLEFFIHLQPKERALFTQRSPEERKLYIQICQGGDKKIDPDKILEKIDRKYAAAADFVLLMLKDIQRSTWNGNTLTIHALNNRKGIKKILKNLGILKKITINIPKTLKLTFEHNKVLLEGPTVLLNDNIPISTPSIDYDNNSNSRFNYVVGKRSSLLSDILLASAVNTFLIPFQEHKESADRIFSLEDGMEWQNTP